MKFIKVKTIYVPPIGRADGFYRVEVIDGLNLRKNIRLTVDAPTLAGIEAKLTQLARCVVRVQSINPVPVYGETKTA